MRRVSFESIATVYEAGVTSYSPLNDIAVKTYSVRSKTDSIYSLRTRLLRLNVRNLKSKV